MNNQQGELKVCLRTPKIGTLAFFFIMMILVPILLVQTNQTEFLKYYLPFVVMLASTLTSAGAPDNFADLYPLFPTTVVGFLSANLINFFALAGILWIAFGLAIENSDQELGVVVALIMIMFTFPVATQAIPFFIRQGDLWLKRVTRGSNIRFPGDWHKYFLGFLMMTFLIVIEIIMISLFTNNL